MSDSNSGETATFAADPGSVSPSAKEAEPAAATEEESNSNSVEEVVMEVDEGSNILDAVPQPPVETDAEMMETVMEEVELEDKEDKDESVEEVETTSSLGDTETYGCRERTFQGVEIQCCTCYKWFRSSSLQCDIGKCVPFMTNYVFSCKLCSTTGIESFSKKQASWRQICQTVLANLTMRQRNDPVNPGLSMFSKDRDIIPYLDLNWEALTTKLRGQRPTWHHTLQKTMVKDADIFMLEERPSGSAEADYDDDYPKFGLCEQDLSKICPNYESLKLAGSCNRGSAEGTVSSQNGNGLSSSFKSRSGYKRNRQDTNLTTGQSKKTRSDYSSSQRLPAHGFPLEHPFNKDGYRYTLAEPDPYAPSKAFDLDQWAGKPIPAHLYRNALPRDVLLALHDRAPQLKVYDDRLQVAGDKGYCTVRGTHAVSRGGWYYEATVQEMPADVEAACRLGWSQTLGNLQAPLGYDKFSYSWRSKRGTKFHQSRGKHYSQGYGQGDVLGFYIYLPPQPTHQQLLLNNTCKDKALIKFKNHLYFEEKDFVSETEKNLKTLPGSKLIFYKNGKNQGVAWTDIYEGMYYPALSLYRNAIVSVNFGPHFKYPPQDVSFSPIQDMASQSMVENTLSDLIYHVEHEQDYLDAYNNAMEHGFR